MRAGSVCLQNDRHVVGDVLLDNLTAVFVLVEVDPQPVGAALDIVGEGDVGQGQSDQSNKSKDGITHFGVSSEGWPKGPGRVVFRTTILSLV